MIRIEDLAFAWPDGAELFGGLTMTLPSASVIAVLGPNGTGKSTLFRLIAGLERPERGRIEVAGTGVGTDALLAQRVGAVMQNADRHFLRSTVLDEVATGPRFLGRPDPEGLAQRALQRVGLAEAGSSHPLDLDAGARRLVGLASAIAHEPQVLLLDEIQRGLDRINRQHLQAVIAEERDRGATVLIVSHDAGFIQRVADQAIRFSSGGISLGPM